MAKIFYGLIYLLIMSYAVLHVYTLPKVIGYEAVVYLVPKAEVRVNDYSLVTEREFSAVYIEPGAETGFCVLNEEKNYCDYVVGVDYLYLNYDSVFEDVTFIFSRFVLRPLLYHLFAGVYVDESKLRMPD
ncbi:hypothetical protein I6F07_08825 [Ensifer sp. IC4062]|nr:hypothetical protein [Ensifer sp. IC4062]MCA1440312.1 hypothetical protein [Ensifer sp. IC4062]